MIVSHVTSIRRPARIARRSAVASPRPTRRNDRRRADHHQHSHVGRLEVEKAAGEVGARRQPDVVDDQIALSRVISRILSLTAWKTALVASIRVPAGARTWS
jgi:hypothetical protein